MKPRFDNIKAEGDKPKLICVDFDRTIMDHENVAPGHKLGYPEPGVVEALTELHKTYHIVVLTARTKTMWNMVERYLHYFQIPFDRVTNVKPEAIVYIDDRAIRYQDNWKEIVELIGRLDSNPELHI